MIRRYFNKARRIKDEHLSSEEIIRRRVDTLAIIARERYVKELLSDTRYDDKKRLERYGFKVYSQYDEDGIIQEIFNRIGLGARTFVELGVENGLENNTLKLLLEGWSGLWIEGSENFVSRINAKFRDVVSDGRLRVAAAFIDRDNINSLIEACFRGEIDLLSIDIDGNDIHIFDSIEVVSPRVIIIEYNGKFPPPMNVAQRYNPDHRWKGPITLGLPWQPLLKSQIARDIASLAAVLSGSTRSL